jgi:hypothetical protein
MDVIFYVLLGGSVLIGFFLMIYGIFGLVKGETYAIQRKSNEVQKVEGGAARRTSLFYVVAGGIWLAYALYRLLSRM